MRPLVIPPAAQRDETAVQMLSGWIAENGLHCTMNVGFWRGHGRDEAHSWGIFLADVARHIGNAIQEQQGVSAEETVQAISASFTIEMDNPTSAAAGAFSPGHS